MTAGPRQPGVVSRRARNDPAQYDDLAREWWRPHGAFAMLHWIAEARSALVPPASRPGAVLVDIGCGGGPLAPHITGKRHTHVGAPLRGGPVERLSAWLSLRPVWAGTLRPKGVPSPWHDRNPDVLGQPSLVRAVLQTLVARMPAAPEVESAMVPVGPSLLICLRPRLATSVTSLRADRQKGAAPVEADEREHGLWNLTCLHVIDVSSAASDVVSDGELTKRRTIVTGGRRATRWGAAHLRCPLAGSEGYWPSRTDMKGETNNGK